MVQVKALRLIALTACSAMFAILPSHSDSFPMPTSKKVVTVTERDSSHSVKIRKGDTLLVRLEAQLSTRYGWQIAKTDNTRLKSLGEPVVEPGKELAGGIEHQVFRFRAMKTGSCALEMQYVRPWEKDKPPARMFMVKIRIR